MHKETVIEVLRFLEAASMVIIKKAPGKKSVYQLTAPSKWKPVGNGERSELDNAPVGKGERNRSEMGNVRKSNEGNPMKEVAGAPVEIPENLNTPEFRTAWNDWLDERRKKKIKPYTERGAKAQLALLSAWGPEKSIAAITHSITQGYQGIYEEKQSKGGANGSRRNEGTFNANTATKFRGVERLSAATREAQGRAA
jgi:hypothetical protein